MFKKAMIKIMDEKNKTTDEVDGDPVLKKEIEEAAMTASSEYFLRASLSYWKTTPGTRASRSIWQTTSPWGSRITQRLWWHPRGS